MISHETQIRVRYGETDQMGVVYHGVYAMYLETGRTEMVRDLGFTYKDIESRGILMPVTELNISFRRPALYDDLITVRSTVNEWPDTRLTVESEILNAEGKIIASGRVTLAFVDSATRKTVAAPGFFTDVMKEHWK